MAAVEAGPQTAVDGHGHALDGELLEGSPRPPEAPGSRKPVHGLCFISSPSPTLLGWGAKLTQRSGCGRLPSGLVRSGVNVDRGAEDRKGQPRSPSAWL